MELMAGIGILVAVVLAALHFQFPKNGKIRFVICLAIGVLCCFTKTMHGVFLAIALICGELLVTSIIEKYKKFIDM